MRRPVTTRLRFPSYWHESRALNWFGSVGRCVTTPERGPLLQDGGEPPGCHPFGKICAIEPQPDSRLRTLGRPRVSPFAGSRWRQALSRTSTVARLVAATALAVGVAGYVLPSV